MLQKVRHGCAYKSNAPLKPIRSKQMNIANKRFITFAMHTGISNRISSSSLYTLISWDGKKSKHRAGKL